MTEKIGLIKNPLTIIAIFAGIAEVSGTIVLPFISSNNQSLFIYFLILFPSILVILFFITLNFNNKVLYAPSDYKDEQNYIKKNKFDISRQANIEVKVLKDEKAENSPNQILKKIDLLNLQIKRLENLHLNKIALASDMLITDGYEFLVSNFENANKFISVLAEQNIHFSIYLSYGKENEISLHQEHQAIWLGSKIPIAILKPIFKTAKLYFPQLRYIKIFDEDSSGEDYEIYIGGSTEAAKEKFHLRPLNDSDFETIQKQNTLDALHSFIKSFY